MEARVPIYLQIQEFIRGAIDSGRYKDGARLPSEPELAKRFGTTRATVARALQELNFEGLIARRPGSGTYVRGKASAADRIDTSELQSFEDHVKASGRPLRYRVLDFARRPVTAAVARRLGEPASAKLFRLERVRLVGQRPVGLEHRFLPQHIGAGIAPDALTKESIQNILQDSLGLRIARIDVDVRAELASPDIARALEIRKGVAVIVREHTIIGLRDRPLVYGEAWYPNDFRIRYTLAGASRHRA